MPFFCELLVYLGGTSLCFGSSSALPMFGTYHVSVSCLGELSQEQTLTVCGSKTGLGESFIAITLMNGSQVSRTPRV